MKTFLWVLVTTLQQVLNAGIFCKSPGFLRVLLLQLIMMLTLNFVPLSVKLKESFDLMHIIMIVQFDMRLQLSCRFDTFLYEISATLLNTCP